MKKNTASQFVNCEVLNLDGSDFSGTVTVYVTGDNGSQTLGSVGSGVATSKGRGLFQYAPAQAETNYDTIAFTFIGSGAASASRHYDTTFPQTGDAFTRLGAPAGASTAADIAAIKAVLPSALVSGRIDSSTGAMAANVITAAATASDYVTEMTAAATAATPTVTAGTVSDKTGYTLSNAGIDAALTRSMTEAYAADGSSMSVAQALYLIAQTIGEFSISGTTILVKKLDGSTTAATYTLDSATTPSSRTRAS